MRVVPPKPYLQAPAEDPAGSAIGEQRPKLAAEGPDFSPKGEICHRVQGSWIPIYDSQQGAALFCNNGEGGGRLNPKGRAKDKENPGRFAKPLRPPHGLEGHRLSKGHRGRFQKAVAGIAPG